MPLTSIAGENRAIVFVEWGKRDTANNWASDWDPNPDGDQTFGTVRLSSDGTDPPSHTACNTLADSTMKQKILEAADNVPFSSIYWISDGWDWPSALQDMGLQEIDDEVP